jgi:hypothetical protein
MTVKELIEVLSHFNPNTEILIKYWNHEEHREESDTIKAISLDIESGGLFIKTLSETE